METLDTSRIIAGNNDRTQFNLDSLQKLADSIRENGLIQAITVRKIDECDLYEIVAGERRFRACADILAWETVPANILDLTDEEAASMMLAENVSRDDIDPIDEARAYQARIDRFGWSVADCAERAGVSSVRVQFRIKLLKLRADIQDLIRKSHLQIGYAQILADANLDAERQMLAITHLRDNLKATPKWFRKIVNDLLEQQAQACLIDDLPIMSGKPDQIAIVAPIASPPHPSTTSPPATKGTIQDMLTSQASFWEQAAKAWDEIGKPFKRQECEAAAKALQTALLAI